MKLTRTTLAISSILLANSVGAAVVYSDDETQLNIHGRAQGMYYFSDDKTEDGDNSYIRVGLSGKSQINDELYAFGLYELEFKSNRRDVKGAEDDEFDIRKGYIGFGSDLATFSYGRQYGAVTLVSDYTDIFPEFGNEAAGVSADVFGSGRSDAVFKATAAYQGLNLHVSYQAENDEVTTDATAYGIAADYQLPYGFKVALGYNEGEGQSSDKDAELVIGAIAFEYEEFYISALYSDGENWAKDGSEANVDYEGIEAVATYQVTDELLALVGYNNLERNDLEAVDYYSIGAEYDFSSNFKALVEYKINENDGEDDVLAVAARYSF